MTGSPRCWRESRDANTDAAALITDDVDVALQALKEYDVAPDSSLRLLNLSENATYLVDDAATGRQSILRVHRQNYHEAHQIASELDWLAALRRDGTVTVPAVIGARDGRRVVTLDVAGPHATSCIRNGGWGGARRGHGIRR